MNDKATNYALGNFIQYTCLIDQQILWGKNLLHNKDHFTASSLIYLNQVRLGLHNK